MVLIDQYTQSYKMNPESLPLLHPLPPLPRIEGESLTLSVFIHQSSNMTSGHPSIPQQYDSDRLAELGEQVCVSINYRNR